MLERFAIFCAGVVTHLIPQGFQVVVVVLPHSVRELSRGLQNPIFSSNGTVVLAVDGLPVMEPKP